MMKASFRVICFWICAAGAAILGTQGIGNAAIVDSHSYSFTTINTAAGTLAGQLTVDVVNDDSRPGQVDFTFTNNVGTASNVAEIYFQGVASFFSSSYSLLQGAGSSFATGSASPPNLPSGNDLTPDFKVTTGFVADNGNGNGINDALDFVTFRFTLINSKTYSDVFAAIDNAFLAPETVWAANGNPLLNGESGIRMGLHVRSIGTLQGGSAAFINGGELLPPDPVPPVSEPTPEPVSIVVWSLGLACAVGGFRFRRKMEA